MTDVVDKATRSRMMSGIRAANTKPEILLRRGLHARGFRFRLHRKDLPGSPDIVLPRYRAVIQVHGCFWHGHGCALFRYPKTNPEFWLTKIQGNRNRDLRNDQALLQAGWRVLTVWECATRRSSLSATLAQVFEWITSSAETGQIPPAPTPASAP